MEGAGDSEASTSGSREQESSGSRELTSGAGFSRRSKPAKSSKKPYDRTIATKQEE